MLAFKIARAAVAGAVALACLFPIGASASSLPSGERSHGAVTIEPAYDDMTGGIIYLQTPNQLAPLAPTNVIAGVNAHSVAPLYLVVYPPGTTGTLNCMGVPGNCPDHGGVVASVAVGTIPTVYGSVASAVPGHDHLVGVARTGGDFNAPWDVHILLFKSSAAVTHVTTLAQLEGLMAAGQIMDIDTGIVFLCSEVSEASYLAGTPVG